jgi:predicted DNA-binding transcriptional regulator YafY
VPEDSEPFGVEEKRPAVKKGGPSLEERDRRRAILVRVLETGGLWTVPMLSQRTGATRATLYKDLCCLKAAGVPIKSRNGQGYWIGDAYDQK